MLEMSHRTARRDLEFLGSLAEAVGAIQVVEVGSWTGGSAWALARTGAHVHCVDTWEGNEGDHLGNVLKEEGRETVFRAFCENTRRLLFKKIHPHVGSSLLYASVWPFQADLIFLDAEHTKEALSADIGAWWPKVREGGILCGHDFNAVHKINTDGMDPSVERDMVAARFSGVQEAVEEHFGDGYQVGFRTSVWYVKKGDAAWSL